MSNEPFWQGIPSFPFVVLKPVYGAAATEKTELLMTYDDRFLYLAGRCYTQDTSQIVARTLVRDGYRGDDWMTIHIDSRFDHQNAVVFSMYPLGSRYDMAVANDAVELGSSTFNPAFNMIWEGKSVINRQGWFFEMKIPLFNLRFKPDALGAVQMAISATRAIQHKQEYHQFPAVPRNAIEPIMKPSLKQPIILSHAPKPRLLLLTPYVLAGRERITRLNPAETGFDKSLTTNLQAGLDAKVGISSYLTLDVSANPDFAQAEVDDQLVNLSRFSVFFPERRLFFQEQAGLFEFNLGGDSQLFYSRQIGINSGQRTQIYGGLRLTGKLNPSLDLGVLSMQSANVHLDDGQRQPSENFSVFRLRQQVLNRRSYIGTMFTSRVGARANNYTAGVDAILNTKGVHYVQLAAATSITSENGLKPLGGLDASRVLLSWETRQTDNLYHKLSYIYSGRQFNPAVGFVDRPDNHNLSGYIRYGRIANTRTGRFQNTQWTLLGFSTFLNAHTGQLESQLVQTGWQGSTFKGTQWSGLVQYSYENLSLPLDFGNAQAIPVGRYHFPTLTVKYIPASFREIRVPVSLTEGFFYNGKRFNASIDPTVNLGKHIEIQSSYDFSYLRFAKENLYQPIHVGRLKVAYALDLHFSMYANLQYNSTNRQIFTNAQLRYNFRDGHDLYIVLNENLFTERRYNDQLVRPILGDQTLLFKYYYTFQAIRKSQ
ncbi:DUF5916 domain-containing protein [Larkinella sp. VNQ87]|uniref:DUF5916 domain-containing protein n=1 Tax=Larkinella sp. VNQ87 TaxID=3400921 RepID=UPI003C09C6D3